MNLNRTRDYLFVLVLVLTGAVLVARHAGPALLKKYLTNTLPSVETLPVRGDIGDLEGKVSLPLGLGGGDVDNDAGAGQGGLPNSNNQDITGKLKPLLGNP